MEAAFGRSAAEDSDELNGRNLTALWGLLYLFNPCCPFPSLQGAHCVTRHIHQTAQIMGPSPLSLTPQ